MGDLVRAGKIRYFAFSDMPAWVAMKAATIADRAARPRPVAMQVEYSLVARDVEREHVPAAREAGMGVVPWSPLAGGFLTGKYRREDAARERTARRGQPVRRHQVHRRATGRSSTCCARWPTRWAARPRRWRWPGSWRGPA